MSIIQVQNPRTDNVPKTYLAVDQGIGVGTLYVKNPLGGFNAQWGIQIGETGENLSEVVLLNSSTPSGTSMVLSGTTLYAHAADTPIYGIKYDKVVFGKNTSGTTGTTTPISNGTVAISPEFTFTQFDDTSGASTDWYRTRFQSSALAIQTSESDWFSPAGYSFYSQAQMVQRVKDKLWSSGYITDDGVIKNWINEWKDEMANAVISVNEDYALGSVSIGFGTNGLGTVSDATFTNPRRMWVTYDGGISYAESIKMDTNDAFPSQSFITSAPRHTWVGNSVFQVYPASSGGTASLLYYQFGTTMVNDTDELPQPMRSYTKSFIDYALAQALFKDQKMDMYDRTISAAYTARTDFVNKIANRDKTNETYVNRREVISGDDGYWPI